MLELAPDMENRYVARSDGSWYTGAARPVIELLSAPQDSVFASRNGTARFLIAT
jgi:hypothetical protein